MTLNTRYTDFDHTPMLPVRDGFAGEAVFAEAWQRLMSTPVSGNSAPILAGVLEPMRYEIQPQDAKVLASIVTWFGTKCGKLFLEAAARLESPDAYLMAWGLHNFSLPWVSGGRRVLENVLYGADNSATMTMRQHDVAQCLMYWLGHSIDAKEFMQACEAEIERRDKEASFVHYLSANCHLRPEQVDHAIHLAKTMLA